MSYRINLDEGKNDIVQNIGDAWKVSGRGDVLPIPSRMTEAVPTNPQEREQPMTPAVGEVVSVAKSVLPKGSAQPAKFGEIMTVPQSNLPKGSAVPSFDLLGLAWWEYLLLAAGGVTCGYVGLRFGTMLGAKAAAAPIVKDALPIVKDVVEKVPIVSDVVEKL